MRCSSSTSSATLTSLGPPTRRRPTSSCGKAQDNEDSYRAWFGNRKPCVKGSNFHNVNDELGKLKDTNPTNRQVLLDQGRPGLPGRARSLISRKIRLSATSRQLDEVRGNARGASSGAIRKNADADTRINSTNCRSASTWSPSSATRAADRALADILALAGNTHCDPVHFSFLVKDRFCERSGKLAKQFISALSGPSGTETALPLNAKPDATGVERVRYIPQTYLEKVCTETEPGRRSNPS